MPNTTNFNWVTPADTDYVKDGANAIRTLANGIDTSLVDLKGGTTGQILSKNSNTDLDYTWINNDQGDITNVAVTSPITGGGSSGSVTIGIDDGTTAQKGAVQLTDSTSSTSTTTAATPNSVKSAYDLANGAIPKTLTTTTGDIIYASSANTPARLGIGTSGQVLTVSGGVPSWAAAAGGGKILQVVYGSTTTTTTVASTSFTDSGLSASITPSSTSSKVLVFTNLATTMSRNNTEVGFAQKLLRGSTVILSPDDSILKTSGFIGVAAATLVILHNRTGLMYLDSPSSTSSLTYKIQIAVSSTANGGSVEAQTNNSTSNIILMEVGA